MSLEDVVKIDMDLVGIPTYHLYDELFKIGVTQVMYRHVGEITSTVKDIHGMMHSYGFTRG